MDRNLARLIAGDRATFDELTGRLRRPVADFIAGQVRPSLRGRVDPEEILQETLVRAFRSLPSFRGRTEEDLCRWLCGIARRAVWAAVEEARRGRFLELQDEAAASGTSPSRAARREERLERLEKALAHLKDDHREVLRLARLEGLPMKEIARRMGRSEDAAKKLFRRALAELRRGFGNTESLGLPARRLEVEGGSHERG